MSDQRMTSEQLDAYEQRWQFIFFSIVVALIIDVAYLFASEPRGSAKAISWAIAAGCIVGCILAWAKLHAGYTGPTGGRDSSWDDGGAIDVTDIFSVFTDDD